MRMLTHEDRIVSRHPTRRAARHSIGERRSAQRPSCPGIPWQAHERDCGDARGGVGGERVNFDVEGVSRRAHGCCKVY